MKIIRSVNRMQQVCLALKQSGRRIGFVPTMGYLHDGHLSLVAQARAASDLVVASIFVNPAQFNNRTDLAKYPRATARDLGQLKRAGVDIVFLPTVRGIYPPGFQTTVNVEEVTRGLCGATRLGHFCGVTTVVLKLFSIVQPNVAVFGKKDYQQFVTIKTMVRDLHLPVRIIGGKTVREQDGLAMSSRNARLSPEARRLALALSCGLRAGEVAFRHGQRDAGAVKREVLSVMRAIPGVKIEYVECRHAESLIPLKRCIPRKTLLACAAFVDRVRLIDNLIF